MKHIITETKGNRCLFSQPQDQTHICLLHWLAGGFFTISATCKPVSKSICMQSYLSTHQQRYISKHNSVTPCHWKPSSDSSVSIESCGPHNLDPAQLYSVSCPNLSHMLFPTGGTYGKEPSCQPMQETDMGLILGLGRSRGVWSGNPLQYSCLEDPMEKGTWQATVHGVAKGWTWLRQLGTLACTAHTWKLVMSSQAKFTLEMRILLCFLFTASLIAQLIKDPPAMQETPVRFQGWEDPLEEGKATHSSILAWRIPWTIQSMG